MILKKDLIEKLGEQYAPMINQISIPDFTKCIAYYAGLSMSAVSDSAIEEYLSKWAINKLYIFKMLGNKTKVDTKITYKDEIKDYEIEYNDLASKYPAYALWLLSLDYPSKNKINYYDLRTPIRDLCQKWFPHFTLDGSSITHFFKKCLNAPEALLNDIAAIYEHSIITSNFTISIDPVDMMLASENPYNWTSCYRLEPENDSSHADGCLAAVLDKASLITYAWDREGDFALDDLSFKKVRYKRMREWIAISKDFKTIHFNDIYPGKWAYPIDFKKMWRNIIENYIAEYLEVPNIWIKAEAPEIRCSRKNLYGYGEYSSDYIYVLKNSEPLEEELKVYDECITCPCGCGSVVPGTDDEWYVYNGGGLVCENFNDEYCEEEEDYCFYCDGPCSEIRSDETCGKCEHYLRYNPIEEE